MTQAARALISVSDKSGISEFAGGLHRLGIEILSTGGTATLLRASDIPVTDVSSYTGFPEMMDGRLKTLHPKVHGGILARRGVDDGAIAEHGISPIDLVVVNLYPFAKTVADPGCSLERAIENIDIGGPTMVRAAAKNYRDVAVVVDPFDYDEVLAAMSKDGIALAKRYAMAVKAFTHTAAYDAAISNYLGGTDEQGQGADFSRHLTVQLHKRQDLRYGENPHQRAAFYTEAEEVPGSIAAARQLQGKELSFNNIADTDAALDCVSAFESPACVIVKHANPCGVAEDDEVERAYDRAYSTDPTSAFGGIIAINRPLTGSLAKSIVDRQFVEVIAAPAIEEEALKLLAGKPNVRVLSTGSWDEAPLEQRDYRRVTGGLLVQDRDLVRAPLAPEQVRVVSKRTPGDNELQDLYFAWKVVNAVKSNAIVYARDRMTIGIGAGQMSRVVSARIAGMKAADEGLEVKSAVMASDAFFPFRDSIDTAAAAGISAVIQPGGSMRDKEVVAAADEHGIAMMFTGTRHFRH